MPLKSSLKRPDLWINPLVDAPEEDDVPLESPLRSEARNIYGKSLTERFAKKKKRIKLVNLAVPNKEVNIVQRVYYGNLRSHLNDV